MLLVGPQGQTADLYDGVGSGTNADNATITFDDAAAATVPNPPVTGTFKPTQEGANCLSTDPALDYPSPAPTAPYGVALAGFNGTNPNGTWSLYVVDTSGGDSGSIAGGWSLDLTVPTGTCKGRQATRVGTAGNDVIQGTNGPDVIVALGGNDKVSGLGGKDRICGDAGKDTLNGGGAGDRLYGGLGSDRLNGGAGADRLFGQRGRDRLADGPGDRLNGGPPAPVGP
jgi:Ca2+-binding RTX toxin-like protein